MDTEPSLILVVEDSTFFASAIKRLLRDVPMIEIDHAGSLAEARALIDSGRRYALALVDIILPDAADDEVVELCREAKISSVVFSGVISVDFRERLMALGVIDYIIKDTPASLSMLASVINRILKNRFIKALVVDDSRTARQYIRDLLEHYKFQTFVACDGTEALAVLEEHPDIRLIVCDFHMPKMDGIEMVRAVRASYPREKLAIIGISSGGGSSTAAMFIKHGANDFITKPFLREEFFFRVNQNMDTLDLISTIQAQADSDYLTGLHNRRYLIDVGGKLYASQKRNKLSLTVAMIDIDHFKLINDQFGHDAGDDALVAVSTCLRASLREADLLCRYGGEEFCVLAVNLLPEHRSDFFERIRKTLMAQIIAFGDHSISLTVSIGVCTSPCTSLEGMVRVADLAMYEAKKAGRNRVVIA
ncbi:diguanylate cyclase [Telmatospirillum sp.]|uniref:diguanylate cyclase n=1 Tax=Telmatospirillum sp. TaxID=2079197 RepID=UPI0028478B6A|nr:diguanylate cyclase [Telmatospirillum sp.]MDR3437446.1 diguanylate cyclase [Telmatospirillum sp.]